MNRQDIASVDAQTASINNVRAIIIAYNADTNRELQIANDRLHEIMGMIELPSEALNIIYPR